MTSARVASVVRPTQGTGGRRDGGHCLPRSFGGLRHRDLSAYLYAFAPDLVLSGSDDLLIFLPGAPQG